MQRIWKYVLEVKDFQTVTMPAGAIPLSVQVQGTFVCLRALVDDAKEPEDRRIRVVGTGHEASGLRLEEFVGTFQLHGGGLIFHVFVEPSKEAS